MDDIKIKSIIDFKTYFNISLLIGFRLRTIIIMSVIIIAFSYATLNNPSLQIGVKVLIVLVIIVFYGGVTLARIYFSCRRNMKRSAYLAEPLNFTINNEKIEVKAETVSSSTGWEYFVKMTEREKYFLLLTTRNTFYYLPKDGFKSDTEIARFKDLIREKGLKMTYN